MKKFIVFTETGSFDVEYDVVNNKTAWKKLDKDYPDQRLWDQVYLVDGDVNVLHHLHCDDSSVGNDQCIDL